MWQSHFWHSGTGFSPVFFRAPNEISSAGLSTGSGENYPHIQPNFAHGSDQLVSAPPEFYKLSRNYKLLTQGRRIALYCDVESRRLAGISDIPRSQSRAVRNRS